MRRGQTVRGFTEAELGFFLTLLLLFVYLMTRPPESPATTDTVSRVAFDSVRVSLVAAQAKLDSIERQRLRSRQRPGCLEKGLATGPLFQARVLDADVVLIAGRQRSLSRLEQAFGPELARADSAGCVHVVKLSAETDVMASVYQQVIRRLQKHFYVNFD